MPENKKSTLVIFLAILGLALIWGSSFILVKKSLVHYSALQVGALRICAASLFFIPIFLKRFKYMEKKHISSFLLTGLTGNLIPAMLFAIAGQHLSSALSGMLNAFTPLFTLFIGIAFFAQPFIWKQMTGILVGLLGCLGLLFAGQGFNIDFNIHGLWVVLATLLYGINMHLVKTRLSDMHPLTSTAGIFMVIGPLALIVLIYTGFFSLPLDEEHLWSFISAIALGLFGSAIGMLAFNQIIKWTSAIIASSVTYMIPIVALGWGFVDGEAIYLLQVVSMFVLLAGIYLVNKSKN
jgi:drug/metabolite transporter (DMT)-like permease